MLRSCTTLLRRGAKPGPLMPVRRWNQPTHIISTPPREPFSLAEALGHGAFMFVVWLTPLMIGLSQIKIWKRRYLQANQ